MTRLGAEPREVVGDPIERHVPPDREVVDEREREDDVGVRPIGERRRSSSRPAEARARVGEVEDERQDRARAVAADLPVVALRRGRVDVPGDDPPPERRRRSG